jgi:hypothetical protein
MLAMRFLRVGLLVAIALGLSGCGASREAGSAPAGADFAPASAAVFVSGVTDPGSSQWEQADKLLGRFPGREKLLAGARKDLEQDGLSWERDVKPALGEEISLVVLNFEDRDHNTVFFTKPKDEVKFNKLLESGEDAQVHRKIDGWTVFADSEKSLDNFAAARSAGNSLSEESEFKAAMGDLRDDAALRGYVSGKSIYDAIAKEAATDPDARAFQRFSRSLGRLESVGFSVAAEDDGVAVAAAYKTDDRAKLGTFSPELDDVLPSGALVYASFGNLEDFLDNGLVSADRNFPEFKAQRTQIEEALGFSMRDDLFPLFSKEGALAIYRGGERTLPNVLFALRVPDDAKAKRVVDRLAALASLGGQESRTVTIHGVEARVITIPDGSASIFAAVSDGKAYASNSKAALEQALGDGEKLADDDLYQEARAESDAPDETSSFVYLNLKAGLPYVFDFAELGEPGSITPDVTENTKPLQSALLYAKQDGDRTTLSGFVTIK